MLDYDKVIKLANGYYADEIMERVGGKDSCGNMAYMAPECFQLRSGQVKAVAKAIVEEMNAELAKIKLLAAT